MKKLKKQRSVVPVYLIALVWAVGGFGLRVHKPLGFAALVLISAAVFFLGRLIWRDRKIVVDVPEPEEAAEEARPEPEEQPEPAAEPEQEPEDPEIAALRTERDRAVGEMRRLNDSIKDPVISEQIDHIEATTGKIFDHVMARPEKKGQIRRFLNYYLPTTIKLLNAYDRLDEAGISGANIDGAKGKIGDLMATIVIAFDHQLDALFRDEVMDINAEIKVLENVLTGDGLVEHDSPMSSQGQ